jgi:hypothetical protein
MPPPSPYLPEKLKRKREKRWNARRERLLFARKPVEEIALRERMLLDQPVAETISAVPSHALWDM